MRTNITRGFAFGLLIALMAITAACSSPTAPSMGGSGGGGGTPTNRPATITLLAVTPDTNSTVSYQPVNAGGGDVIVRVNWDFGDQKFTGPVYVVLCFTDRPGYFIWEGTNHFDSNTPSPQPHISLRDSTWGRQITTTTKVVAYLTQDENFTSPPRDAQGNVNSPYKSEAGLSIIARTEMDRVYHWQ